MRRNKKNILIGIIIVFLAIILLGFNTFKAIILGNDPTRSTREVAMSCTLDMYTQFHIHPHLRIVIHGQEQPLPANIGITLSCMHPLHTHDTTGEIHVESPEVRDFTLGDFFAVWDKVFSKNQIFEFPADDAHEIVMTVNGSRNEEYENLILKDKQEIVIEYREKSK